MTPNKDSSNSNSWSNVTRSASLGLHLVLSSAVGILIGFYLDKWLKTSPILLIIFFAIGIVAGFRQIFKEVRNMNDEE
jgi:ATP synthase protein I